MMVCVPGLRSTFRAGRLSCNGSSGGLVGCWQGMDSRQVGRLWQVQPGSH